MLQTFKEVDVGTAGGADPRAKEKILGIIEASFGELRLFDRMVTPPWAT